METKPGWKTTEFWITLVCQGTGLALLFGWIDPSQAEIIKEVGNMATSNIFEIIGGIMQVGSAFGYGIARGIAKQGIKPE